jgi:hypothetical protein
MNNCPFCAAHSSFLAVHCPLSIHHEALICLPQALACPRMALTEAMNAGTNAHGRMRSVCEGRGLAGIGKTGRA